MSTVTLMMSAAATSATLSASVAPASASGVIASARTSKTVTPPGHSTSRLAIGAPMIAEADVAELHVLTHERMICPPSTLKIWPVIHFA